VNDCSAGSMARGKAPKLLPRQSDIASPLFFRQQNPSTHWMPLKVANLSVRVHRRELTLTKRDHADRKRIAARIGGTNRRNTPITIIIVSPEPWGAGSDFARARRFENQERRWGRAVAGPTGTIPLTSSPQTPPTRPSPQHHLPTPPPTHPLVPGIYLPTEKRVHCWRADGSLPKPWADPNEPVMCSIGGKKYRSLAFPYK